MKQAGKSAAAMGASMQQAGSSMTRAITLPLVALGGVAIKTFSDFDGAMVKSTAIMGDLSDTMRDDMAAAAKEVALTTSFSAKEAAESFFFLASAGLSAEAQLAALPAVSKFAQAGMFDMALATDLLTDAQSALGLTIRDDAVANLENMTRVSDVLAKANVLANATIQQFSESLTNQAGASMKVFSKDVEEGVAVLAAFADQGVKGQVAGSSLARIMKLLSAASIKNKDAMEKYNIEVFDSQGNMNNMADILGDMEVAFGDMSDEARTAALNQLGFKARVQGVILPLLGTSEAIRTYEAELRKAGGTTEEIAKNQLEAFAQKMGLLKDRIIDATLVLGAELTGAIESLIPIMERAVDVLKRIFEGFATLPTPVKLIIIALVTFVAALGPILLISGGLIAAFGQVSLALSAMTPALITAVKGTGLIGKAFQAVTAILGGGGGIIGILGRVAGAFMGPVGLAVGIGIVLLKFKPFRELLMSIGGLLVEVVRTGFSLLVGAFRAILDWASPLIDALKFIGGIISGTLGPAFGWLSDQISESTAAMKELREGTEALRVAEATASSFADTARDMTDALKDAGEEGLRTFLEETELTEEKVKALKGGLSILEEQGEITRMEFDRIRVVLAEFGDETGVATDHVLKLGQMLREKLIDQMPDVVQAIDEGREAGKSMNAIIQELFAEFEVGTVKGDALRAAFIEVSGEMNATARSAAALAKKQREQAEESAAAVERLAAMEEALKSMGIITEEVAAAAIEELTLVMETGEAPARMMAEKMVELSAKLADVAAKSPEVRDALNALAAEMDPAALAAARLDVVLSSLGMVTIGAATDKINALSAAVASGAASPDILAGAFLALQEELKELAESQPAVATALADARALMDEGAIAAAEYEQAMSALGLVTETVALEGINALVDIISQAGEPTAEMAAKFLEMEEALQLVAQSSPAVQTALENARDVMGEEAIAAAELAAAIAALNLTTMEDLEAELEIIRLAFEAGAGSPAQLEAALKALQERADKLELGKPGLADDIEDLTGEMAEAAREAGRVEDPFKKFADVISALGVKTIPATLAKLKDMPAAIRAGVIPMDQLGTKVDELDAELKELAKDSPEVAAALRLIEDAARDMGAELDKDTGIFGKFKNKLGEGIGGLTDPNNIAGLIGTASDAFLSGDFLAGTEQIVSEIGATIGAAFGPIGKMVGQLAGKLVPLIAGIFSKPEFKKIMADAGRDLGVELSEELAKAIGERSKELGSQFAAITEALPEIIAEQGIKSAESLSTFVARARDNLSMLDQGLFTSAEAFGNMGESLALLIPEMDNFGAGTEITAQVFETLNAALGQVRTGLAETKDAVKLLDETFPLLVERLDDMGVAGVMGIRSIIDETRALGIEVESVTKFVIEKTGQITNGVTMMVNSLKTRISQLPEDLNFAAAFKQATAAAQAGGVTIGESIAEGAAEGIADPKLKAAIIGIGTQAKFAAGAIALAFSEAIAQGVPITEVVQSAQAQLKDLSDVFVELGIEAPESFKKISAFARKLAQEDVAPVIEGIQGMGQAMEGLSDLALVTQQDFSDFGTTMVSSFDQLKASGLSSKEVFAAIGPQLQQLAELQSDFGFEVDAGTAALLEQASAAGVVKGVQLDAASAVSAGFQGLFDRFDLFLEKQGVATDGLFQFGDQAAEAMGRVGGAVTTTANTMATQFSSASSSASDSIKGVGQAQAIVANDMTREWGKAHGLNAEQTAQFAEVYSRKLAEMGVTTEDFTFGFSSLFGESTNAAAVSFEELERAAVESLNEVAVGAEVALASTTDSVVIATTGFVQSWSEAATLSGEQIVEFNELTKRNLEEMGASSEDAAAVMSGAFDQTSEDGKKSMENLQLAQDEAMLEMQASFTEGALVMAAQFDNIATEGGRAFGEIAEAAGRSARDAIDAFGEMEDELVGASIFPDTASAATGDLEAIGDAAVAAASAAEGAFGDADLSMGTGLGVPGAASGSGLFSDVLDNTGLGLPPAAVDAFRHTGGDGGGGDLTINLVVDGQVLAKTVIKNTPRALANAGLNNRTR
jgi:TP901 family phage tail tape measure protein